MRTDSEIWLAIADKNERRAENATGNEKESLLWLARTIREVDFEIEQSKRRGSR